MKSLLRRLYNLLPKRVVIETITLKKEPIDGYRLPVEGNVTSTARRAANEARFADLVRRGATIRMHPETWHQMRIEASEYSTSLEVLAFIGGVKVLVDHAVPPGEVWAIRAPRLIAPGSVAAQYFMDARW